MTADAAGTLLPDSVSRAHDDALPYAAASDADPGSLTGHSYRAKQIHAVALRLGITEKKTGDLLDLLYYRRMIDLFARIRPSPHVVEALTRFSQLGLPMGLLSDLPPWRKLELMGLTRFFGVILCSEDAGHLKPHPAGLLATAQALGYPPSQILYVGNNPHYDLAGARAAGMAAAIVSRKPVPGADFSFSDWRDLIAFVETHCGAASIPPDLGHPG
jgi:HAD superfamily hydrolase (TIGR01549 family)